ncbi:membrane-bound serine protease (ClpP class) [Rhodococcus sp. AG1013]|uniref:NfeD family protein n=1 Tax=Rhodococcus sp. AG1013 TaxID=2183996 RepID=UPI000E0CB645|nr:NfeD family protein [Rhodococcus sp. AG1013]RDI24054.1 membrane-bound serine protease (ClpP class) [Rhodococcus sp. AG1013]
MAALGVLALVVGVLLIVIEAHVPTFGALGITGTLLSAAGVWLLFTSGGLGMEIAVPAAAGVAVVGVGAVAVTGRKVLSARREPVRTGAESMIGSEATVRSWDGGHGQVEADGGLWRARMEFGYTETPRAGESVVVEHVRGLTLSVRRREPWELSC